MLELMESYWVRVLAWLCGGLIGWWSGLPSAFHVLLYAMALDVLLGLLLAASRGDLRSHRMWLGVMKKVAVLFVVEFCRLVELEYSQSQLHLTSAVALAFTGVEGVSIGENLQCLGVPLPGPLRRWFRNARKACYSDEVVEGEGEGEIKGIGGGGG